jgi:predicted transcriptional regulator
MAATPVRFTRIDDETFARVEAWAEEHDRTASWVMRVATVEWLERNAPVKPATASRAGLARKTTARKKVA